MFGKKIRITLILGIILLLSVVSVAQAAPPLQGRSGISQGQALDLDAEGNNLGTVVKSSNTEDGPSDNGGQNPVATALANYFDDVSYEEIMALHESGVGFGNIAKALFFTSKFDLGIGAADLAAEASQSGWGKTLRNNGIHPGSIGKGRGNQPEHAGAKANNGQGNGNGKGNNGQGDGNGKGNNIHGQGNNGQGHGKGKNKGDSDGADLDVDSGNDDATDTDVDSQDDDAADTDVDSSDDNASDNNGKGKGKGINGQGQGKGNNGKGNGKSKGNGNNGQGHNNNGNNGQNGSDGN